MTFCVFLPPLLNIFCFCYVDTISILYCAHLCKKCSLGISNFLMRSLVFPIFFCFLLFLCTDCSVRLSYLSLLFFGTLHSNGCIFPFLLLLHIFSLSAICKVSSDNNFAFLLLFFLGKVLITASCTMLWTSVLISSGTLSDRIPRLYLSLQLYNHKGVDLGHTWMVEWFSLLSST